MEKEKGIIQLYIGEGKGKTSALNGSVIRMLGWGKKVYYTRFLKNLPTGEMIFFKTKWNPSNPNKKNIKIDSFYKSSAKFFWDMNTVEQKVLKKEVEEGFKKIILKSQTDEYDLIVIDELFGCLQNNLIQEKDILDLIKKKKNTTNLIITGRFAPISVKLKADLITNFQKEKHYFDKKIKNPPRKGIEF